MSGWLRLRRWDNSLWKCPGPNEAPGSNKIRFGFYVDLFGWWKYGFYVQLCPVFLGNILTSACAKRRRHKRSLVRLLREDPSHEVKLCLFFFAGSRVAFGLACLKKKHRYFLSRVTVSFPGWLQPRNANLGPQFCFLNSYWFTSSRSRTPGSKRSNWICWVPWFLPHLAGAQTLWPSVKAKGLARAEVDEDSTSSMAWPCHPCQCQPWKRHHQGQEERRKVWKDLLGGHQAETQVKLNAPWMVFQDQPKSTTRPIKKGETVKLKRLQKSTSSDFCCKKESSVPPISLKLRTLIHQSGASKRHSETTSRLHRKNGQVRTVGACRVPGSMTSGEQIYLTISWSSMYSRSVQQLSIPRNGM